MESTQAPAWRTEPMSLTRLPEDPALAMAYVPVQLDTATYTPADALDAGTLFPVLDKPFLGRRVGSR